MKRRATLILVGIMVFTIATSAVAFNRESRRFDRKDKGISNELFKDKLDLSEQQSIDIKKLRSDYREESKEIIDELIEKKKEVRGLYFDKAVERNEIVKLQQEVMELKSKLMILRTEHRLDIRELLTEEQLKKMKGLSRERFKKRRGFRK